MDRVFVTPDRRIWLVRARPTVRRNEVGTHVTLELMTDNETRVVSCPVDEWELPAPDFERLLARSVASGASRSIPPPA
jgi:hypothetical protein